MNQQFPSTDHNEQTNPFEEASRQARESTRKIKRRILIVFAGMVVFAVVGLVALGWLDAWEQQGHDKEKETVRPTTIIYFEPDYDYNILEDEEYLGLDRYIYYTDKRTNETIILEDKDIDRGSYGAGVKVLKRMVDAIVAGDHEAYNALFSSNYFKTEGNEPEDPFTMQQIYAIKFTRVNEREMSDEEFGRYTQYEFIVEYKIHKNNGTLHIGVDHDATLKRYFVLSDSTSNQVLIDQIGDFIYVN